MPYGLQYGGKHYISSAVMVTSRQVGEGEELTVSSFGFGGAVAAGSGDHGALWCEEGMAVTVSGKDGEWYEQRAAVVSKVDDSNVVVRRVEAPGEGGARAVAVEETIPRAQVATRIWPHSLFYAVETATEAQVLARRNSKEAAGE